MQPEMRKYAADLLRIWEHPRGKEVLDDETRWALDDQRHKRYEALSIGQKMVIWELSDEIVKTFGVPKAEADEIATEAMIGSDRTARLKAVANVIGELDGRRPRRR